jgi:hypothetical protein
LQRLGLLEGVNVTLLTSRHHDRAQLAVNAAVRKLGGDVTTIYSPTWELNSETQQFGKYAHVLETVSYSTQSMKMCEGVEI